VWLIRQLKRASPMNAKRVRLEINWSRIKRFGALVPKRTKARTEPEMTALEAHCRDGRRAREVAVAKQLRFVWMQVGRSS